LGKRRRRHGGTGKKEFTNANGQTNAFQKKEKRGGKMYSNIK